MWHLRAAGIAWLAFISLINATSVEISSLQNTEQLCERYENFTTADERYTVITNQWGADGSGSQCLLVGDNKNASSNSTAFAATWSWATTPNKVHAYPNIKLNSLLLPLRLANLSSLNVDLNWTYSRGSYWSASRANDDDEKVLANAGLRANVALDIFFDADPVNSTSTTTPKYELMIWFGDYGGVEPVGFWADVRAVKEVEEQKFSLYTGSNSHGQRVFTWLAPKNLTSFIGDISPLVRTVAFHGGPNVTDYMGVIQFGTEAFHTDDGVNVTFTAERVSMNAVKGVAPVERADGAATALRMGLPWLLIVGCMGIYVLSCA